MISVTVLAMDPAMTLPKKQSDTVCKRSALRRTHIPRGLDNAAFGAALEPHGRRGIAARSPSLQPARLDGPHPVGRHGVA